VHSGDLRNVRLLLDFHADPNRLIRPPLKDASPGLRGSGRDSRDTRGSFAEELKRHPRSLISTAVFCGYPQVVAMLLAAGADVHPEGLPPLIAALNQPTRDAFALLIEDHIEDIMTPFNDRTFLMYAIEEESGLLPIIASLTRQYLTSTKRIKEMTHGLKPKQKKELQKALAFEDGGIFTDYVRETAARVVSPWQPIDDDEGDDGDTEWE
jgi:hypothetical protein